MSSVKFKPPNLYRREEELIDEREFEFGQIWQIRDSLISIPDADRLGNRNEHFCRTVIVVDNNPQNSNPFTPVITVAPLSHRVDCLREFDIPLYKDKDRVAEDCILRMSLAQPVLKKDLYKCVGMISMDSRDEIIDIQLQKVGINLEELLSVYEASGE